jgi:hypothetical protein
MLSVCYLVWAQKYAAKEQPPHKYIIGMLAFPFTDADCKAVLEFLNWTFALAGCVSNICATYARFATLAGSFNIGGQFPISCSDVSNASTVFDWWPYRMSHLLLRRDAYDDEMAYLSGLLTACQTHYAGIAFGVVMW